MHICSNWIKINPAKAEIYCNETTGFEEPFPKILTAGSALESVLPSCSPKAALRVSALEAVCCPLSLPAVARGLQESPWVLLEASLC